MAEHARTSDTETGFGTGLRAKLGRAPEGEAEAQAPPPGDEGFAPPLPAGNGVPDADVEALRGELAAALARERDLQAAVADLEQTARSRTSDFQVNASGRSAELDERAARLEDAIESLTPSHRDVILLRKFEELSFAEIGQRLGKSEDACRMLLARAMTALTLKMSEISQ